MFRERAGATVLFLADAIVDWRKRVLIRSAALSRALVGGAHGA